MKHECAPRREARRRSHSATLIRAKNPLYFPSA